jgi:hypothetical protein
MRIVPIVVTAVVGAGLAYFAIGLWLSVSRYELPFTPDDLYWDNVKACGAAAVGGAIFGGIAYLIQRSARRNSN